MTNLDVSLRLKMVNQLGAGAKAAEKDLKGVKDAAQQIGKGGATEKLGRDLAQAGGKARIARKDVGDLRREAERLGSTRGRASQMAADFDRIGRSARTARGEVDALARAQGRTSGRAHRTGPVGGAEMGMGAGAAVGALGMRAVAPVGVGWLAKKSFDQSVDWDTAWTEVLKKVNDADEGGFKALEKTIRRLSLEMGIGRSELAGLVAEAGAAGVAYSDLERFMQLTGKAAVGWDMAPREASEKLAYTKAAMGLTVEQMSILADKINALGDNSAAKERDILEMFLRVGSAAREAGVDMDSTLSILTGVRSGGMEPEVAARWFGALTGGLRTAELQPKRVDKGLQMLGTSAKKVAKGMKTDAIGTLLDLFERLEKSPKAVEAATSIFGREWWDETMRAKGGIAEIRKQLEFIRDPKNYKGSLDKGYLLQAATARAHLAKTKELVSRIGEALTSWTLAPFNATVDAAISRMDALSDRMERGASVWERWTAAERARLEASGELLPPTKGEVLGPPMPDGMDDAPEWIKRLRRSVYGSDRTADSVIKEGLYGGVDWLFGRAGDKDQQIKEAEEAGVAAAKAEKAQRLRGMIDQRQRLEKQKGNPAFPDQDGIRARAAALDTNLRKALGSADLGPVAREEMEAYVAAIAAEGTRASAEAQRIAAELQRILSFTARPTIDVPLPRPSPLAPGAGAAPTTGKRSSLGSPVAPVAHTTIHQHIHGGDSRRVAQLARHEQEREIRRARAGALHDTGAWA